MYGKIAVILLFIMYATSDDAPSVIIVGAGPSGIAAASRLLQNNITNIKVLEAENRIGGRIYSANFGDGVVDLGAEICHGGKTNAVYQLVEDSDLLQLITNESLSFHDSSHKHINQELAEDLFDLLYDIYYGDIQVSDKVTLGDYITNEYTKQIGKLYSNNAQKLKFATKFLSTLQHEVSVNEGTFSWFDPSANSDYEISGNELEESFHWKGRGYKTIIDFLMKNYPNEDKNFPIKNKIFLNKEVIKIEWDNEAENGKASVKCLDNSVYTADHVLVTTSLGVLKDRYTTLFSPSLPQQKIDAIEELGIGGVAKVAVHFPTRWWAKKDWNLFTLIWNEEDKSKLVEEFPYGPNKNGESWLSNMYQFYPVYKNPNALIVWFIGNFTPEIELAFDDTIIDGITFVLEKFFGHEYKNLTKPDALMRFNWYNNPHFRGAYSYQTVKSRKRIISGEVALSQPLTAKNGKETLLFAGEATNPIHYATVHGAIETGFREADRIINYYKLFFV